MGTRQALNAALATPDPGLYPVQERGYWEAVQALCSGYNVVFQSPTGSGKTRIAAEWMRWAAQMNGGGFYINRRALIGQTSGSFEKSGIDHGIRAADFDEKFEPYQDVQIVSAPTEHRRCYGDDPAWSKLDLSVVVIDEAHIQKGRMVGDILEDHIRNGTKVILLSATPVALHKMVPNAKLIKCGTVREFRDCGLLVPAYCKSIEQPDLRKVKRNAVGDYVLDGEKKRIYCQQIVANVLKYWEEYNPDQRHTMLYAPGKPESVWFTQQFEAKGVKWCHVDSTEAYLDGKRISLTRGAWDDILGMYSDNIIKGISSRFKLREGVDVPQTYHVILATPIGSLASYLQTVGRALRSSKGKECCLIQDHGGNYWRHGSANHDRDWDLLWRLSPAQASSVRTNAVRDGELKEPIRCPECNTERLHGIKCMNCNHTHPKGTRRVIQEDGSLHEVTGNLIPRKRVLMRRDTQQKWNNMYFGFRNGKKERSFRQMEAFFCQQHGYWPPRTLDNMPKSPHHWHFPVYQCPREDLIYDNSSSS